MPSLWNSLPCLLHWTSSCGSSSTSLKPPRSSYTKPDAPSWGLNGIFLLHLMWHLPAQRFYSHPFCNSRGQQTTSCGPNLACCLLFWMAPQSKNSFYIFKWLKNKSREEYFVTSENYTGNSDPVSTKFYWNITVLVHLSIAYSCFHTSVAELRQQTLCGLQSLTYWWSDIHRKILLTFA